MMRLLLTLALLCAAWAAPAAVTRCEGHYTYIGLEADTKPTAPQVCDRFKESDTGDTFIWSGSAWAADNLPVSQATLTAGEDQTNDVQKVEERFSYKICTADCQISAAAGFVHSITCATPAGAAVAAGAITLRNAATETTPVVATIGIPNSAFTPFTLVLDTVLGETGMYLGYDGTVGAVSCTVSYR